MLQELSMDINEREAISALADGEAPDDMTQALVSRVLNDAQSRELYLAHRRAGDLIRAAHDGAGVAGGQMADAVMMQVNREAPLASSPEQASTATVLDLVARGNRAGARRPFAMAAAVLLAAGLGFFFARQIPVPYETTPIAVAEQTGQGQISPLVVTSASSVPMASESLANASPAVNTSFTSVKRVGWDTQDPGVQRRLQGYLVSHSEYLGRGMRGMHPYARVVAYAGAQR
jgi:negative regulator of sigma E activity